jgi:D-beta-D-heptose 7-phosphate kinase/D-beta-D-heptose 1-phosphate adenosyltransferase
MMRRPAVPLDARRAAELVERFGGQSVLVVGDVMLDRFIVGRVTRISPEAPVPVVHFQSEYVRLGGAANVAHNIAALGGRASLAGVVGADAAAKRLAEQLGLAGVMADGLVCDSGRPTTEKVRVVTERNQQVARIDYERESDVGADVERALTAQITRLGHGAQALLVSDYLKGAVTRAVVEALLAIGAAGDERVPLLVDPKIPHLACYAGATLVTPNQHEAETATHMRIRNDEDACVAAREFRYRAKCDAALVTRGEHGMWLSDDGTDVAIPANARDVADVTGAGDTVVATLSLALASGATLTEAAILANHAAGIVVAKFGPATVTPGELLASFGATLG